MSAREWKWGCGGSTEKESGFCKAVGDNVKLEAEGEQRSGNVQRTGADVRPHGP